MVENPWIELDLISLISDMVFNSFSIGLVIRFSISVGELPG